MFPYVMVGIGFYGVILEMRILVSLFFLLFLSTGSSSQILNRIKDKVTNKAKNEVDNTKNNAEYKAKEKLKNEFNDIKSQYDSTEVEYAVLLSDNAGVFANKGESELGARFLRLAGVVNSLYRDQDLTDEENARLNLQFGQSAYAAGKYVYAERRLNNAHLYFERAGLTNDLGYLKTIASEGLLFTSMGRFSQAEGYTSKALELRKQRLGEENMAVAASLNNYAVLHYDLGNYSQSEKEFVAAQTLVEQNHQQTSLSAALLLNNKAILFQSMGRYDAAVKLLEQALQVAAAIETVPRNQLKFLSNLALLYQEMGKYEDAESIYKGLEQKVDKGKPEQANLQNNEAILFLLMKNEEKVEALLKSSAAIYGATLGENSPAYAKVVSDLGNYYRYKQRYEDASPLLEQAATIRKEKLGEDHPLYVQSQEDLAILFWKKNDLSRAHELYTSVMGRSIEFVNRYFPPMSEVEKTKYWDLLSPRFERFYNFALDVAPSEPAIAKEVFEYRMATKGLLLTSSRKVSNTILNSGNPQLIADYKVWLDAREQLTVLYAYSKQELLDQNINIDSLQDVANTMEKRLSESSSVFTDFYFAQKPGYNSVKEKLKSEDALIEMIRLRSFDQVLNDQCRYLALVVTKEKENPVIIVFNEGNDMENKYARNYRLSMKNKINDDQSYLHYWVALEKELAGKKKIYLSPDGIYTQLNPNTFKKAGSGYLLEQAEIVTIGNPADVSNVTEEAIGKGKTATLLGFPDYGAGLIAQLPGTKTEVDGINRLLKGSGFHVSELIQKEANETNLKAAHRVSILHIATHGYFLKDVERASWPIGVMSDYARNNVLLRSGLLLAGASESDRLAPGLDSSNNGIMTSYEAMDLDLKGTDLVVLSACETGLGEIKAGEGVYGLQRAFLAAGAKAVIMSLWKVDDAATQLLMNYFYSNWIKLNDRHQAFRLAQQQLMMKYKEPLYWGAFVLTE